MDPFEFDSIRKLSRTPSRHPWIETALIASGFFLAGNWVAPADPLFTGSVFPWSIFAPILAGLRYGFAHAFLSAVGLHAAAGLQAWSGADVLWPLPFAYTLGLLLSAMIVGEFRDIWDQHLVALERSNEYRQARMEEFTRSYHILKISHDELEQEYAGRRTSLRSALLSAREKLVDATPEKAGAHLLELLADFVSARSATYHQVMDGRLMTTPLATLGTARPLSPDDVLVKRALGRRATVSIRPEDTSTMAVRDQTDPIVVIPVMDAYRNVRAVVGIEQIPFFALTERNLQIATIVASRFGDFLHASEKLRAHLDDDLYWFLYQSLRCQDMARTHGLHSCLIVCRLNNASAAPMYIKTIMDQARGLDQVLPWQEGGSWYLLLLMPLTTRQGLERFLIRFDAYLSSSHDVGLSKAGIEVNPYLFEPAQDGLSLAEFLSNQLGAGSAIVDSLKTIEQPATGEAHRAAAGVR